MTEKASPSAEGSNPVASPSPDNPDMSSLLGIEESPHQGRFAVAKEPIPAGTVLASGMPAAVLLGSGGSRENNHSLNPLNRMYRMMA